MMNFRCFHNAGLNEKFPSLEILLLLVLGRTIIADFQQLQVFKENL